MMRRSRRPGRRCLAAQYRAAFARGSAMDQAEAVAFALGESPRPGPAIGQDQARG